MATDKQLAHNHGQDLGSRGYGYEKYTSDLEFIFTLRRMSVTQEEDDEIEAAHRRGWIAGRARYDASQGEIDLPNGSYFLNPEEEAENSHYLSIYRAARADADDRVEEDDDEPSDEEVSGYDSNDSEYESSYSTSDTVYVPSSSSAAPVSSLAHVLVVLIGWASIAVLLWFLFRPERPVGPNDIVTGASRGPHLQTAWDKAPKLLAYTPRRGKFDISASRELMVDGRPVTGPLMYGDSEFPQSVHLGTPSNTGRYVFVSLCGNDWCDDTRLVDLTRGRVAKISSGKDNVPALGCWWSPDDEYALIPWGHALETGFFALKLDDLSDLSPGKSLIGIIGSGVGVDDSHPEKPFALTRTSAVEWTDSRHARITVDIADMISDYREAGIWNHQIAVVGRVALELSIPSFEFAVARRWMTDDHQHPTSDKWPSVSSFFALSGRTFVRGDHRWIFWVEPGVWPPQLTTPVADNTDRRTAQNLKGTVAVGFSINEDGTPYNLRVTNSTEDAMDAQAVAFVRELRFALGERLLGKPASVDATWEVPVYDVSVENGAPITPVEQLQQVGAADETGGDLVGHESDEGPYKVGRDVTSPIVLSKVDPSWNDRDIHHSGTVVIALIVDKFGRPRDATIVQSLDPSSDAAALAAVRQWRFAPGVRHGQSVDVKAKIEVNYH